MLARGKKMHTTKYNFFRAVFSSVLPRGMEVVESCEPLEITERSEKRWGFLISTCLSYF